MGKMLLRCLVLHFVVEAGLFLSAACGLTLPARAESMPPIVMEGTGKGIFPLHGPWQFHVGDDPAWAEPDNQSANWKPINADHPWGVQGYAGLTGYGWYRCRIVPATTAGLPSRFALMVPSIRDVYEIYWNGVLIGRNGTLPPHPMRYLSQPAQIFDLGPVRQGVLAVRVWKAPLLSDDSNQVGGFATTPLIGDPETIAMAKDARELHWLDQHLFLYGENLLCAVLALLSFLLWLQDRRSWVLFWMAGFAVTSPANLLLMNAHMGWPYILAMGISQPVLAVKDVCLWFLLLWLLSIQRYRAVFRLTCTLACIYVINASVDGVLIALLWNQRWIRFVQISDAACSIFSSLLAVYPLALLGFAFFRRKAFVSIYWPVSSLVFVDGMLVAFDNIIKQGRQYTGWSIANNIDAPLFSFAGHEVTLPALADTLLFIAILYAVYNKVREDRRRGNALRLEKRAILYESRRIRYQAEHDGLTDLLNHRTIAERLGQEMKRASRDQRPLSVVLIDIDYFKKVNDTYGHLAGDLVLKEMGKIFSSSIRAYDSVGRYGGEEFLLILPNCPIDAALERAEQLRKAIETRSIAYGENLLKITASFGVVSTDHFEDEPEVVIRAADAALYQAKNSGRNCVMQEKIEATDGVTEDCASLYADAGTIASTE